MHTLAYPGPDGNAGSNSNPGEPTKDPMGLYGTSRSGEGVIGVFPKQDQQ